MAELQVVGQRVARLDAEAKVTGLARYAADLQLPRMLRARLARSPYPHARVVAVDTDVAQAVPGVRGVLTPLTLEEHFPDLPPYDAACREIERSPDNVPAVGDQRLLDRVVRYAGEPVAAIAAETEAAAREAATLIQVDYEVLPAVLDAQHAQADGAPLVHVGAERNRAAHAARRLGDPEAALAGAELVLERRFATSRQKQAQLEPTCCVVDIAPDGRLTVWSPTQAPHRARLALARLFKLPLNRVRVVNPAIGGAFGKGDALSAEPYAVALALLTRRPVKLHFSRREDFVGTEARHPCTTTIAVGFRADGTIAGLRVRALVDAGAYLTHSSGVSAVIVGQYLATYRIEHADLDVTTVFTHTPVAGAFRGYGGPQAVFPLEHMIDLGAAELGVDPLDARRRMRVRAGDVWGYLRQPIASDGLGSCLKLGAEAVDWRTARARAPSLATERWRRGIGMACLSWKSGTAGRPGAVDQSGAVVQLNPDGSALLLTAASDLGTGVRTTLAQICAEELRLPLDRVQVADTDTDITPYDAGAYASRSLFRAGQAVQLAARHVLDQLIGYAAELLEADRGDLALDGEAIVVRGAPQRGLGREAILRRALVNGREFRGYGAAPTTNAPSFAAQFAEVEVDVQTGQVRVLRLVACQDVGRAINPTIVEGQIQGGAYQGLGFALTEGLVLDQSTGTVLNGTFMDYRLLTAADGPNIEVRLVECPDPSGPFGAKGAGEPSIIPTAAAVANAILHATGACPAELPLTPERVRQALSAQRAATPKPERARPRAAERASPASARRDAGGP
jgi:xanthine dehydrogenase molybdenum-binding subunit